MPFPYALRFDSGARTATDASCAVRAVSRAATERSRGLRGRRLRPLPGVLLADHPSTRRRLPPIDQRLTLVRAAVGRDQTLGRLHDALAPLPLAVRLDDRAAPRHERAAALSGERERPGWRRL